MDNCARYSGNSNDPKRSLLRFGYGAPFSPTQSAEYSCPRFATDGSVQTRSWCPMVIQEPHVDVAKGGTDCGALAHRRIACIDIFTHSTVDLCTSCWQAYRQRQEFANGCCG